MGKDLIDSDALISMDELQDIEKCDMSLLFEHDESKRMDVLVKIVCEFPKFIHNQKVIVIALNTLYDLMKKTNSRLKDGSEEFKNLNDCMSAVTEGNKFRNGNYTEIIKRLESLENWRLETNKILGRLTWVNIIVSILLTCCTGLMMYIVYIHI